MLKTSMAAVCVNMETHIFLILLLCSGASGDCPYVRHVSISTPNLMEALSGSCLLIPCTFTPANRDSFDVAKPVVGIWRKTYGNSGQVMLNSAMPSNTYPMEMIGDLRQKNCTTLFSNLNTDHSDKYFFRIENSNFKTTDFCNPLQIKVKDSPWSPSVQISGLQKEEESVTITCSAVTPCPHSPPKLTWNLQQDPPHIMERNMDGTFTTRIQQKKTLSDKHDGLQVRCSAVYPVSGGHKRADSNISLRVEYSPKDTSVWVSPNTSLSVGQSVNLSCSSRARPPVQSFTWFKITSQGAQRVHEGHFYSLIFSNVTKGEYFCQAKNKVGEQNSAVTKLQTGETLIPWKPILGGGVGLLLLICLAVFVWCLVSKRQAPKEAQRETYVEEDRAEDTIHYGEIHFSKKKPNMSAGPVHNSEEPEETVYSQVRVSKAATQPTEDLYATVKKN